MARDFNGWHSGEAGFTYKGHHGDYCREVSLGQEFIFQGVRGRVIGFDRTYRGERDKYILIETSEELGYSKAWNMDYVHVLLVGCDNCWCRWVSIYDIVRYRSSF